jgi:bifunctional UDP-N-acetylglucosamine pyrophosphorylase/glucosamine-1-phosphate N-acetyltransferase
MALSIVILAAGNGTRMQSSLPKVLHSVGGMPLLFHVINTAKVLKPDTIYVVYSHGNQKVKEKFSDLDVNWVLQNEPQGTGHALMQVVPYIKDEDRVLVLYGDVPLIKPSTLQQLVNVTSLNQVGLLVANKEDPNGFGRIIRDKNNKIIAIVEHRDATENQLKINEINTGILTVQAGVLKKWLPKLKRNNAQAEFYLTDIISMAVHDKITVTSVTASSAIEVSGINDRNELMTVERYYQLLQAEEYMKEGVTLLDPHRVDFRGQANIARDVIIDINVILEGEIEIGEGSSIGPNTVLKNVKIGNNVIIKSHCMIEDAIILDNCIIGPFARLRPGTILQEGVHIGNFVELKNAQIDEKSKVNHLTYLGDAVIGKQVNIGAGTITCNYDGQHKFTTLVGDRAFIGSGTELVAPIKVGEEAYIGAGSTITEDAPSGQLTLGRARQVTIKRWQKKEKTKS